MANEYLYGAYGHIGETVAQSAVQAGTTPVYIGTAPVNLVRGFGEAGIINAPIKITSLVDAQKKIGYSSDWGTFTLCEAVYAHFNNTLGNIGPIYVINVLDPSAGKHRKETATTKTLTFTGGRAEFASDKIILDTLTIAKNDSGNYVEGTDYAVDYNFTKGTVIITSLKDDAQLAGSLTASFSEVDDSEIADSDIIGGVTSSGEYSGLSAIALLYPEQFAVCNLIAAPGWSHSPAVYNAMLTTCKKINGHWDAFVVADLPLVDSTAQAVDTITKAIAWKKANAFTGERSKVYWPQAVDNLGNVFHLSTLAVVELMRADFSHNSVPMETCGNKAIPVIKQYFGANAKNRGFDQQSGKELTQNLLSVVFDYDGNLWFATGGFRIYPEREQQGVLGYIAHSAIEAILNGEQADLSKAVFVYGLALGEGAENGIAASKDGAVILTNQNCYLLRAEEGVDVVWCTPYESAGAKVSGEGDKTTGGGLAWGGGCSPTLTPNLVLFTDNQDIVNLLALDMKTGEVVASAPVLDDLPEGYQVAVENSAIVYDDGNGTVSTIVCNWFGAGNAGLADPNNDSSIQSYANIYDQNWLMKGNVMIAPGIERMDTVKTANGYEMKSIWSRNDLSDTSILKLSTATGYIYGYVQDVTTGMWQYIILDFETGETVFTMDVSNKYGYNNMAIGMYAGNSGNALYCPTGYLELLRLQDRFVYLPEMPYRKVDLDQAARNVLLQEQFAQDGGEGTVASWRNTVTVRNVHPNTTVAFRMNNLSGSTSGLTLYAYGVGGKLAKVDPALWSITDEDGKAVTELTAGTLYELRVTVADGGALDLSETEKEIRLSVVLGK